jgi:hypothetical protein
MGPFQIGLVQPFFFDNVQSETIGTVVRGNLGGTLETRFREEKARIGKGVWRPPGSNKSRPARQPDDRLCGKSGSLY